MTRLALPDAPYFALETPTRPMHAGALMLFDPPTGESASDFAARVVAEFRRTRGPCCSRSVGVALSAAKKTGSLTSHSICWLVRRTGLRPFPRSRTATDLRLLVPHILLEETHGLT
jgi:hypothetical protein